MPPTGTKCQFSAAQRAGSGGLWSRLVAPTGTNGLVLPRAQKFSPTSLVERAREWFISAAAPTLPSSSQLQAFRPNLSLQCLWAYWACCGPESWPMVGFLVVIRPWGPSRWHFFLFFCFLFCFIYFVLFLLTTKNLFILFYFVSNYLFILLYDNSFCY